MLRMRTGYCNDFKYIHKIGILHTTFCECGHYGDLQDLILECRINYMASLKMTTPMWIQSILQKSTSEHINNLC